MNTQELFQHTREALPYFSPAAFEPIEKGGSSRSFFRVLFSDGRSAILIRDLGEKEENRHYSSLALFLASHAVPVPGVLAEKEDEGLLWLEDLGRQDLWAFRNEAWEVRRPLYESVLRGIALLHRIPVDQAEGLRLQKEFDERLYRWEQEYFVEHCLGEIFGVPQEAREALLETPSMQRLARELAREPRRLVHRDFQSQNILIRDGNAWFIDFQGMRPGLPQYDLASLLCDPYVEISAEERSHLLATYRQVLAEAGIPTEKNFDRLFWRCAIQRLMQALGAYGFLSLHCNKPAFLAHVSPALRRLREALEQLHPDDRLDDLQAVMKTLDPSQLPASNS